MTRKPSLRQQIDALLTEYEPKLKNAFLASITDIRSQIVLKTVVERLERRDIEGALDALNLDRAAFGPLEAAIQQAYNAGGTAMVGNLPTLRDASGARVVVRFDPRNIRAENWLRTHSANLVTGILDDKRNGLREILETGMSRGQNPERLVTRIAGIYNKRKGIRENGLIGLASNQMKFVDNPKWYDNPLTEAPGALQQLESGDPKLMRNYLTRTARPKGPGSIFERSVKEAIAKGKPVSADMRARIVASYESNLTSVRARTIARTETLTSLHAAKDEGFRQGLGKTNYPPEAVTRVWRSAGDGKVRDTHSGMNGQEVHGLDAPFHSPSGALLRFPGDTGLGAGAAETINCRCNTDYRIDFSYGLE